MGKARKESQATEIDVPLLEKQLDAMLASSFRDEYPEECDGIASLLGAIVSAGGKLGKLLSYFDFCDEMDARFAVPFAMSRGEVADAIEEWGGDPCEAAIDEAFERIEAAGMNSDFLNEAWWNVVSGIVESVVLEQRYKRFVVVSSMSLESFGWIQFRWSSGDEEGSCGIEIATGDVGGFDHPTDHDACETLHSWLEAFRSKVAKAESWPSAGTILSVWESVDKKIRF